MSTIVDKKGMIFICISKGKKFISILLLISVILSVFNLSAFALSWKSGSYNECDDKYADTRDAVYTALTEDLGLNHAAACGVLGNIWAESEFNSNCSYSVYYGLCQWSTSYYDMSELKTEEKQIEFLCDSLRNTSTHKKLLALENSKEGALEAEEIFRTEYERCGTQAKARRQNATLYYYENLEIEKEKEIKTEVDNGEMEEVLSNLLNSLIVALNSLQNLNI